MDFVEVVGVDEVEVVGLRRGEVVEGEEEECEGENSGYGLEWLRSWSRKMDEGRRCQKRYNTRLWVT